MGCNKEYRPTNKALPHTGSESTVKSMNEDRVASKNMIPIGFYDAKEWHETIVNQYCGKDDEYYSTETLSYPIQAITASIANVINVYGNYPKDVKKLLLQVVNPLLSPNEYEENIYTVIKEQATLKKDSYVDAVAESLYFIRILFQQDKDYIGEHFKEQIQTLEQTCSDTTKSIINFSEKLSDIVKSHVLQVIKSIEEYCVVNGSTTPLILPSVPMHGTDNVEDKVPPTSMMQKETTAKPESELSQSGGNSLDELTKDSHGSLDKLGPSIWWLKTGFMAEVVAAGLGRESKLYEIENLDGPPGVIRQSGMNSVSPVDKKMGSAYVHTLTGQDKVGTATVMLSYTWAYTIGDIIDTLEAYCRMNNLNMKRTYVWICCLCINQHRVVEQAKLQRSGILNATTVDFFAEFGERVTSIGHVLSMMGPWHAPIYLTRAWCIFEIYTANQYGCKVTIVMTPEEKQKFTKSIIGDQGKIDLLYEALANTRVEQAGASIKEDLEKILEIVENGVGCVALNNKVNELLRQWVRSVIDELVEERSNESLDDEASKLSFADFCSKVGLLFWRNGEHDDALTMLKRTLEIRLSVLGEQHLDTATVYNNMAGVLKNTREYDLALNYLRKAISVREAVLGGEHLDTAGSYNNLGAILDDIGDLDSALDAYSKALAVYETKFGDNNATTATTHCNIGGVLKKKGDHHNALVNYYKCLEVYEACYTLKHPDIATVYNNISNVLYEKGDYEGCTLELEKVIDIRKSVLGDDHPQTMASCDSLRAVKDIIERKLNARESETSVISMVTSGATLEAVPVPVTIGEPDITSSIEKILIDSFCDSIEKGLPNEIQQAYILWHLGISRGKLCGEVDTAIFILSKAKRVLEGLILLDNKETKQHALLIRTMIDTADFHVTLKQYNVAKAILIEALDAYSILSGVSKDTFTVSLLLADIYRSFGVLEFYLPNVDSNQWDEKGVKLLRSLQQEFPRSKQVLCLLATLVSYIAIDEKDHSKKISMDAEAIAILDELESRFPSDFLVCRQLAKALQLSSFNLRDDGNHAVAERNLMRSLAIVTRLVERYPSSPVILRDLSCIYSSLCTHLQATEGGHKKTHELMAARMGQVAADAAIAKLLPKVPDLWNSLVWSLLEVADIQEDKGRKEASVLTLSRALESAERSTSIPEPKFEHSYNLVRVLSEQGRLLSALERETEALQCYDRAYKVYRTSILNHPKGKEDDYYIEKFTLTMEAASQCAIKIDQIDRGISFISKAIQVGRSMKLRVNMHLHSLHCRQLAEMYLEKQMYKEAISVYEYQLHLIQPLFEKHPYHVDIGSSFGDAHLGLGNTYQAIQDTDAEIHHRVKFLKFISNLHGTDKKDWESVEELRELCKDVPSIKRFTIPCLRNQTKTYHRFTVVITSAIAGKDPLEDQARMLKEDYDAVITADIRESFRKLHDLAIKNNVSFQELCDYVIGGTDEGNEGNEQRDFFSSIFLNEDFISLHPTLSKASSFVKEQVKIK